jgi:hypothetical protein
MNGRVLFLNELTSTLGSNKYKVLKVTDKLFRDSLGDTE